MSKRRRYLNRDLNIFGFLDGSGTFLTKTGDVGAVLRVTGRDPECMTRNEVFAITQRIENAIKTFDDNTRFYFYVIKRNRPNIERGEAPRSPVAAAAWSERIAELESRADNLYSYDLYIVALREQPKYSARLRQRLNVLLANPKRGLSELLSEDRTVYIVEKNIARARDLLLQQVNGFVRQLGDTVPMHTADRFEAFIFFRRLMNYDQAVADGIGPTSGLFLDHKIVGSHVDIYRDHLKINDNHVKVLTLKEKPDEPTPNVFGKLLNVPCQMIVVLEFKRIDNIKMRRIINHKKRHFYVTLEGIITLLPKIFSGEKKSEREHDLTLDESSVSMIDELKQCLVEMERNSRNFGQGSLTVVLYGKDRHQVEGAADKAISAMGDADAELTAERPNCFDAFLATFPGSSHKHNRRLLYFIDKSIARMAFVYAPDTGRVRNRHLGTEYLALLETAQQTPYYFNQHDGAVAHTAILGATGAGKSFLSNCLIQMAQKYGPYTFIFDMGGSYEMLTRQNGGSYLKIGTDSDFGINPFSMEDAPERIHFLASFVKFLMASSGQRPSASEEHYLLDAIRGVYRLERGERKLSTLRDLLPAKLRSGLRQWTQGGQYARVFDNAEDSLTTNRFQTYDFEGLGSYPVILEPLLYYLLHRVNSFICDPANLTTFKLNLFDETWKFLGNETIREFITEAEKTWRRKNAAIMLATQSAIDLIKHDVFDVIRESCATQIFLANPRMAEALYSEHFGLNEVEAEKIVGLRTGEALVRNGVRSKVLALNVGRRDYWLYTNTPYDTALKAKAIAQYPTIDAALDWLQAQPRAIDLPDEAHEKRAAETRVLRERAALRKQLAEEFGQAEAADVAVA